MVGEQQVEFAPMNHTCPLRRGPGPWDSSAEGIDEWRAAENGDLTCSFCGSWRPEEFFAYVPTVDGVVNTLVVNDRKDKLYCWRAGVKNAREGAIKMKTAHLLSLVAPEMEKLINEKVKLTWEKLQETRQAPRSVEKESV